MDQANAPPGLATVKVQVQEKAQEKAQKKVQKKVKNRSAVHCKTRSIKSRKNLKKRSKNTKA